ncbi:cellulose binding domain-containing protein [Actinomadura sp. CNU-125]|uniref:cellulose binding domain-containing protein n=1 Tax=Actinomadura sp. CNU-125 TaxID=1904961 RepID=UPI003966CCF0
MPVLRQIQRRYGIDFRENLGDLVANNTDLERADLTGNVFFAKGQVPPERCAVTYRKTAQTGTGSGTFTAALRVTNLSRRPLDAWAVRFRYGDGQEITGATGGGVAQNGADVPISDPPDGGVIAPGRSRMIEISGKWRDRNTDPSAFSLNTTPCRSR